MVLVLVPGDVLSGTFLYCQSRLNFVHFSRRKNVQISTMPDWPTLSVHYYADERFETGIRNVQEGKNQFRIYDIEKTVVDIVFFREKIGIEETKEVLINYLRRSDRDLNRLLRYAELLKCSDVLKTYLEVLV